MGAWPALPTRPASPPPPLSPTLSRRSPWARSTAATAAVVAPLVDHLSEPALNRARVHVEVEWLIHLTEHEVVPGVRHLSAREQEALREVVASFGADEVEELAVRERVTQHDVKAVEYFLKQRLTAIAPAPEDAGPRRARALLLHERGRQQPLVRPDGQGRGRTRCGSRGRPASSSGWRRWRRTCRAVPLLAHTHGQPATPTTMGKELAVLAWRLQRQLRRIEDAEFLGKFNGATGTYGAHVVALPDVDWQQVSRDFVEHLGPLVEPPDDADREPRLAVRALRRRRTLQPGAPQHVHRRLDVHLDGLLRPGAWPRQRRLVDDAAQGQPDPVRERRGQPRGQQRPAGRPRRHAGPEPPPAGPHRLLDAAQHRDRLRPQCPRHRQRRPGARRPRRRARPDGRGPRGQLGGAGGADPVGDAGAGRPRRPRHGGAVRTAQGAHPRPPHRPRATSSSSCTAWACRPRSRSGSPP